MKSNMRRLIIDKLLTEKGYVAFEEFELLLKVSAPTIKRDLQYMRDELHAPIRYSRAHNGYYYASGALQTSEERKLRIGKGGKAMPAKGNDTTRPNIIASRLAKKQWYSSEELFVLTSTYDLLGALEVDRSSALATELPPLRSRVLGLFTLGGTTPRELMRRVRVVERRVVFQEPATFETIGCALCEKRRVRISYYSWRTDEHSTREISPMRLVHYRNRWYVDAFCHLTQQLKTFQIENIESAEILTTSVKRMVLDDVARELDAGYGIFHGKEIKTARLHFDGRAAHYVLREAWHPKQRVQQLDDGSLMLLAPYSDPTEIVGEILRWGSRVEVLEPQELRDQVSSEAERIAALYKESTKAGSRD